MWRSLETPSCRIAVACASLALAGCEVTVTDPPAEVPPSCRSSQIAGSGACGPDHESCCTSLEVPGGTFFRTYANDGSGPTAQADPATVSRFRLDKYLVTVGRYRQFRAALESDAGFTPPASAGTHAHLNGGQGLANSGAPGTYETGWLEADGPNVAPTNDNLACNYDYATWTNEPGEREALPVNCINWWEAYAFCIWDHGFLPSEAELEYAAAGGEEQRQYPWGSIPPGKANRLAIYGCYYPDGSGTCSSVTSIAPVGTATAGPGRWGHFDLSGELAQWTLDWFSTFVTPCVDCANLSPASGKAIRDGYFESAAPILASAYRNNGFYPTNRFFNFGFRCARAPSLEGK